MGFAKTTFLGFEVKHTITDHTYDDSSVPLGPLGIGLMKINHISRDLSGSSPDQSLNYREVEFSFDINVDFLSQLKRTIICCRHKNGDAEHLLLTVHPIC